MSSIRWNRVDRRRCLVAKLNTARAHLHGHEVGVRIMWASHPQSDDANDDDQDGDESDDSANDSDN